MQPLTQVSKGSFLIASPFLDKGLYFRSVILLCEHNAGGSFGLVINKTLDAEFPEEISSLTERGNHHFLLLAGGMIQPSQMILLHSSDSIPEQTLKVCENVFLGGNLEFLQKNLEQEDGPYIHLCFGYSAWGPGTLEKEVRSGGWFVRPATFEHAFQTPRHLLWQELLKELGGKYANLAMIPEDLSLN